LKILVNSITVKGKVPSIRAIWGQIFILDFADISQKFPSDSRHFSLKTKKYLHRHPCGFLIGIYLFYENWSTETFRKRDSKKRAGWSTYNYMASLR